MRNQDISKITEEEVNNIHLRSESVKEIMGHIPNRIIRYGIAVIASILTCLMVFSFFFKYPDIISGSFYLQTAHPPAFMLARSTGKIQALLVKNNDTIKVGDMLCIIENSMGKEGYNSLKSILDHQNQPLSEIKEVISKEEYLDRLGDLQMPFALYKKALEESLAFTEIDYHRKKQKAIEQKIIELEDHIALLKKQINGAKKNYYLAQKDFKRDSLLFANNTISAHEYEDAQKKLVSYRMDLTNTEIDLSNAKMNRTELQQQILELQLNEKQQTQQVNSAYFQALDQLKGALLQWENLYCLISPIDGKVAFSGIWEENQNVQNGQLVMTILPFRKSRLLCKVVIPTQRAGKVKLNQEVNLKFNDFPFREYGMVIGRLDEISEVPDSAYIGTVVLSDTLKTNYGRILPFKQNMQGYAEIITEDISVAERLIFPLKALFKEHVE